jgi:hypothetical protein
MQATQRQNFKDIPMSYDFSTICNFTGFALKRFGEFPTDVCLRDTKI